MARQAKDVNESNNYTISSKKKRKTIEREFSPIVLTPNKPFDYYYYLMGVTLEEFCTIWVHENVFIFFNFLLNPEGYNRNRE